jgi:hypothetical protein
MMNHLLVATTCKLYGKDTAFAEPFAVMFVQQATTAADKRAGYLVVNALLEPSSDMTLMLVNLWIKDMQAGDPVVTGYALTSIAALVNKELAPIVLQHVLGQLKHPR